MGITQRIASFGMIALCAATIAGGTASAATPTAAQGYTATDLGSLDEGGYSIAYGMNDRGGIVGAADTDTGTIHAFVWVDGEMTDLGTLPGGGQSEAVAINDDGTIAGTSTTDGGELGDPGTHAVAWIDGRIVDLGTLGGDISYASGINADGQIVGWSETRSGAEHAFLWEDGVMTDLGTIGGGRHSRATAINDAGQIVGRTNTGPDQSSEGAGTHAFLWEDGTFTDLGTLPGGDQSEANGINERGEIVGVSNTSPGGGFREQGVSGFLWDGDAMTALPPVANVTDGMNGSLATSINDDGRIVGWDICDCGDFGLVWIDGEPVDLQTATGAGVTHMYAIDADGRTAGYAYFEGVQQAALVEPATISPEPTKPSIAIGATATPQPTEQSGVVGNRYISPRYGYRLNWDPRWTVMLEDSTESTDRLVLSNGVTTLVVGGGDAAGTTVATCVEATAQGVAENAGIDGVEIALDPDGEPIQSTDPDHPYAVYTGTLTQDGDLGSEGDEVAIYADCRALADDALLVIVALTPVDQFNAQVPELEKVLSSVEVP